ncbi:ABC transporter permease [Acerihabitans arboris]|uniref:ABC transporter permease subunit n=1 Tax=Acerihabitans arboris TaxID=2691583 RepID=A0A845SJ10_9GAMM|nr:ABC transporter permease subunit [Acerihabitans arboris]NDL63929.1 ABC transporter permease subunit [Acerihabitans arboris]
METADYLQLIGFGAGGWGGRLLAGAGLTLAVAVCGFILALVIGALGAWCKIRGNAMVRLLTDLYTTALRGVPDLLVIYLVYFGSSALLTDVGHFFAANGFISLPGFVAGTIAIGVVGGALCTEVLRGGFSVVPTGELEAAMAFGMSPATCFRRVLAPLLLRSAMPGLGNVWLSLLKDSSLLSATGIIELMRATQVAADSTHMPFDFYLTAAAIYVLMAIISGLLLRRAERHYSRGVRGTGTRATQALGGVKP